MVYKDRKKWSCFILLVCFAFAIGSFAYSNNTSGFIYLSNDMPDFTGFFPSIAHTIDWFSGNPILRRTQGLLLSILRNGFFWVFLLAGIPAATIKFARSYLLAMKNDDTSIKKNTILINLLI